MYSNRISYLKYFLWILMFMQFLILYNLKPNSVSERTIQVFGRNCKDCESFLLSKNRLTVCIVLPEKREDVPKQGQLIAFQELNIFEMRSYTGTPRLDQRPGASHINKLSFWNIQKELILQIPGMVENCLQGRFVQEEMPATKEQLQDILRPFKAGLCANSTSPSLIHSTAQDKVSDALCVVVINSLYSEKISIYQLPLVR